MLRLSLGSLFLAHGLLKVLVFTIPGNVAFFGSISYPPYITYLTITGELLGGLCLVIGFYSRISAILIIPVLVGASLVHIPNGWFFAAPNGGFEFPVFWLIALIAFISLGNRAFQIHFSLLDKIIQKLPFGKFLLDR